MNLPRFWEDTADFIAGRAVAAMTRYRQQLLPPLFSALMKYSDIHEYSLAAPCHLAAALVLLKTPPDVSTMTTMVKICSAPTWASNELPSVLCLTILAHLAKAKICRTRICADRSPSVVVGTSGSNRTIMQACMTDNDVVVVDRNCHKSIEQGLMLTGAKPVYMVPSRNRYGIIGPIYPQEMQPETLQKKISESPLTKDKAGQNRLTAW